MHGRTPPPPYTETCTYYILTHSYPPPTLCLCSELEWLVFHFGLPGALLHSLAWPVYHYWSLSLTWTNRGLFSKVVSQVAVTDMSGTPGLRAWLKHTAPPAKKICRDTSQAPSYMGHGLFDNKNPLFQGGRLGVLFLIKSGLMRPAKMGTPTLPLYTLRFMWTCDSTSNQQSTKDHFAQPISFHDYSWPNISGWFSTSAYAALYTS